jgi:hypothetical protein
MRATLLRALAAATTVGAVTLAGVAAGAGPAAATDCWPTPYNCGVVYNSSRYAVLIAAICDSAGNPCVWRYLGPGEVSTKYLRDTDLLSLQCDGVVLWGSGSASNESAGRNIRIYDGNTADVRYQGC